ncbi:T9SS type A sorting domain-containing protein [bacterium]|nr:T9SS type A sorting domain-containing protein [bacterium]
MRTITLLLLALLGPCAALAAVDQWSTYTLDDGLPVLNVHAVAADRRGNVFFGFGADWNGIALYDRQAQAVAPLPCPFEGCHVEDLAVDTTGAVWCLTDEGRLLLYKGSEWSEVQVEVGYQAIRFRKLITDRPGSIWLASGYGVIRYDGLGWTRFSDQDGLLSSNVHDICLDYSGLVWCATDSCLAVFAGAGWLSLTAADGLPGGGYDLIAAGPDGSVWSVTADEKIVQISPEKVITYQIGQYWWEQGVPPGKSLCLTVDRYGHPWVCGSYRYGEDGKGYSTFDGNRWHKYAYPDRDSSSTVTDAAVDSTGNLWFATLGSGVRKLGELDGLKVYGTEQGLPYNQFNAVAEDSKGRLWFGSSEHDSILGFDGTRWKSVPLPNPVDLEPPTVPPAATVPTDSAGVPGYKNVDPPRVYHLATDSSDNLWCGTSAGLLKYDGEKWELVFQNWSTDPTSWVNALYLDSSNNLWVGTYAGVRRWDGGQWRLYDASNGLASNAVYSIAQDSHGDMWFGGSSGKMSRFDGQKWTSYTLSNFATPHEIGNIATDRMGNVYAAESNVGVKKFDGNGWTTMSGISSTWSIHLALDSLDGLWAGNYSGLSKWDGRKWVPQEDNSGFLNSINTLMLDSHNHLWLATNDGLRSFNPVRGVKRADSPLPNGNEGITPIVNATPSLPRAFSLGQNVPNPFNPSTTIGFSLAGYNPERVCLKVYDLRGRLVRTLLDRLFAPGAYSVLWSGDDDSGRRLGSGVYFYRLSAGEFTRTRKMVLLK